MAADLVPIRLSLTDGDRYTVWAPRWRDAGDEWEAFLGKDEDLYIFETPADLVAFVRTNTDNDLVDHPAWKELTKANAHKLEPADDKQFDLVAVEEVVSDKPTEESVAAAGQRVGDRLVDRVGLRAAGGDEVLQRQPDAGHAERRNRPFHRQSRPQAVECHRRGRRA